MASLFINDPRYTYNMLYLLNFCSWQIIILHSKLWNFSPLGLFQTKLYDWLLGWVIYFATPRI